MGAADFTDYGDYTSRRFEQGETRYYAQEADTIDTVIYTDPALLANVKKAGRKLLGLYIENTGSTAFTAFTIQGRYSADEEWGVINQCFVQSKNVALLAGGESAYVAWNSTGPFPNEIRAGITGNATPNEVSALVVWEVQ